MWPTVHRKLFYRYWLYCNWQEAWQPVEIYNCWCYQASWPSKYTSVIVPGHNWPIMPTTMPAGQDRNTEVHQSTFYTTACHQRKQKFFYFGCSLVRRFYCKKATLTHWHSDTQQRVCHILTDGHGPCKCAVLTVLQLPVVFLCAYTKCLLRCGKFRNDVAVLQRCNQPSSVFCRLPVKRLVIIGIYAKVYCVTDA